MCVSNKGAKELGDALTNDRIVTDLVLSSGRIGDEGILYLARALPTMFALQYLDLSSNAITDVGADSLCVAITSCRQDSLLRRLSLAYNRMTQFGVRKVISAVFTNNKMTHIWLQGNRVKKIEHAALLEFIEEKKLNKVNIDQTAVCTHERRLVMFRQMKIEKGLSDDYDDKMPVLLPVSEHIEVFV